MHIFLTGPIGIGKTTVINKTLVLLEGLLGQAPLSDCLATDSVAPISLAGFFTHSGPTSKESGLPEDRDVYISPAGSTKYYTQSNKIASRDGIVPTAHLEVFEDLGREILKNAVSRDPKNPPGLQLIIMDEVGFLEQNAPKFHEAVFDCLDGDIPILGSLRLGDVAWLERVKAHPKVKLITVSLENRDELPPALAKEITAIADEMTSNLT